MAICKTNDINLIYLRRNKHANVFFKTISSFVAFVFILQQVTYGYAYITPTPVQAPKTIEVTTHDEIGYKSKLTGAGSLLQTNYEKNKDSASYSPNYIASQQKVHEDIISAKQTTEELVFDLRDAKTQEEDNSLVLQKKRSSATGGGQVKYTMADFDENGKARQLNVYHYEGNVLKEIISYDVSGLSEADSWQAGTKEIKDKEGNAFFGSYTELTGEDAISLGRILTKTVYSGTSGNERIDYVLSDYDEEGAAQEVSIYDYTKDSASDTLDESRTYNTYGLELDFTTDTWKDSLTGDRLTSKTVYTGAAEEERASYTLDTYQIDEEGNNNANRITIYDYTKNGNDALSEVRTYDISDVSEADWLTEDSSRLESVMVYEGEKDKEKIKYVLSSYTAEDGVYKAWQRTDYTYEEDELVKTKTYDVSALSADELTVTGSGALQEESVYTGDEGFEKIQHTYSIYGDDALAQVRTDYIYNGKTLTGTEEYDIAGATTDSKDNLTGTGTYEGKTGQERIISSVSYAGTRIETTFTYSRNSRGVYYASAITEITYSDSGEVIEKVVTASSVMYTALSGSEKEDLNGNIRSQNIKTYYFTSGVEELVTEEDVIYSDYEGAGRAGKETRTTYTYTDGVKTASAYKVITNDNFDSRGNVTNQTIYNYTFADSGDKVFDTVVVVANLKFDYYGNIIDRTEDTWTDLGKSEFANRKVIHSEYDNLIGRKHGNASTTIVTKYQDIAETTIIDRTTTTTSLFDTLGNAIDQESITEVTDSTGSLVKTARSVIHNSDIDNRGDAGSQEVTSYLIDNNVETLVSYAVYTNRTFDVSHNIVNQRVLTYDSKGGTLLDVQEIRSIGYHSSGVALKQIIVTYANETSTDPIGVKVIENSSIDSQGNIGTTVITTYSGASIADSGTGVITPTGPVKRQVYTNLTFDARGNALTQSLITEVYEDSVWSFSEAQDITTTYDVHDRSTHSMILNYDSADKATRAFIDMQDISYNSYDSFGNVLNQTIDTYSSSTVDATSFVNRKVIINTYDNVIAQRRGNATIVEVTKYSDILATVIIDRTTTTTSLFDTLGNAIDQVSVTEVTDSTGTLVKTSKSVIHNSDIDNRGDAGSQEVTSYLIDNNVETLVSYAVYTNRTFDVSHNIVNQRVTTYDEKGGVILDVQEIRSIGYHSSGVALKQIIVTYANELSTEPIGVKVIENSSINSQGNIGTTVITTYEGATIAENGTGVITPASPVKRQVYANLTFDSRGNALTQELVTEVYESSVWSFSEAQDITTTYDVHDRSTHSVILNYTSADKATRAFIDMQDISYNSYDQFGNVLNQTIDTYSTSTVDSTSFVNRKVIINTYDNVIAQRRGNATIVEVTKYSDILATVIIDRTTTTTSLFDTLGNAIDQESITEVADSTGTLVKTQKSVIHNSDIDNRGDAGMQEVTSYLIDNNVETLISYAVYTNRVFDVSHNIVNQRVLTYDSKGSTLLDVQEIRSIGYHSSGVALKQIIVTYANETSTDPIGVKVIENSSINSQGNIGVTIITTYEGATIADNGTGAITPAGPVKRQVYTNLTFDSRGNALTQSLITEVYEDSVWSFSEAQDITTTYDVHDRSTHSVILNYTSADKATRAFIDMQDISYNSYDSFGNVVNQTIDTYSTSTVDSTSFVNRKVIINTYDNVIAQRRGNATIVEVTKYSDILATVIIDRTTTTTSLFDTLGNAIDQVSVTEVTDSTGTLVKTSKSVIHNSDIDNRGDAGMQEVTSYLIDNNVETLVSYAVYTNRVFDTSHNIVNQRVLTYDSKGGTLLDVQEIRSIGYHSSGVALKQTIVTYANETSTDPIGVKVIENSSINSQGNIGTTVITTYSGATIADNGTGAITPAGPVKRQVYTNLTFDARGNALTQSLITEAYEDSNWSFSEAQDITTTYDVHDRSTHSMILNYTSADKATRAFIDMQDISYNSYDSFGNVLNQTIDTYSTSTVDSTSFVNRKVIINTYTDCIAQRRGNATIVEVTKYSDILATVIIDRTTTTTSLFDTLGNAIDQVSVTEVTDSTGTLVKTSKSVIHNSDIDNRGDAGMQEVTSYLIDNNVETLISYAVYTNRVFDTSHNIVNQRVLTYDEKLGTLLDVQEIRSIGYHSSGVALKQIIVTYANESSTEPIGVKVIENSSIDSQGNIGTTVITTYSGATIADSGTGVITPTGPVKRQVYANLTFDSRGNALTQSLITEVYEDSVWSFSEAQDITTTYDVHDRSTHSMILNYDSADKATRAFIDMQDISYNSYDSFGNVLNQTIDTYSTSTVDSTSFVNRKVIINTYDNVIAQRRGNATIVEVTKYSDILATVIIDRTTTTTSLFDTLGNAIDQVSVTEVTDSTGTLVKTSKSVIHNSDIDNRGDAGSQEVTSYLIDNNVETLVSYAVYTNRTFDVSHNIVNQRVLTYDSKGGTLLDVQEIRSIGYHSSGVALKQIIVTYANELSTEPIGVKVIENSSINSQGNIGKTVITTYEGATIADSGTGVITPSDPVKRQVYTNTSFDARGNALTQELVTEVYEDSVWSFSEAQDITTTYDVHDRSTHSMILNYTSADKATREFIDMQDISYNSYDSFGNVVNQTIDTYSSSTVDSTSFVNRKVITNTYDNVIAQRRGNATIVEVTKYSDIAQATII
ncbi:MAG: hypothetical protein PHS46_07810, partial [Candidatus Omnitrophica bacterium]|nr:hypothetical protein [Candidatus Omnitrophota bacterium]